MNLKDRCHGTSNRILRTRGKRWCRIYIVVQDVDTYVTYSEAQCQRSELLSTSGSGYVNTSIASSPLFCVTMILGRSCCSRCGAGPAGSWPGGVGERAARAVSRREAVRLDHSSQQTQRDMSSVRIGAVCLEDTGYQRSGCPWEVTPTCTLSHMQ